MRQTTANKNRSGGEEEQRGGATTRQKLTPPPLFPSTPLPDFAGLPAVDWHDAPISLEEAMRRAKNAIASFRLTRLNNRLAARKPKNNASNCGIPGCAEEVANPSREVAGASEEIAGSAEELAGSSKEIAGSAEELPGSSKKIAGSAEELAGSSEEIAGSAEEVAGSSEEIAGSAEEVAGSSEEIAGSAEEVTGSSEEIAGSSRNLAGPMEDKEMRLRSREAKLGCEAAKRNKVTGASAPNLRDSSTPPLQVASSFILDPSHQSPTQPFAGGPGHAPIQ